MTSFCACSDVCLWERERSSWGTKVESMESGVATATVDLDKLIIDFSTWEEVQLITF